jgi:hypothetical protein
MAYVPLVSLSDTLTTAVDLKITAYDKLLQERALPEDIFFTFGGNYSDKMKSIPNGIYMKIPGAMAQAYKATFPLLMPLSGAAEYGIGTDPITNAEQQVLKEFIAYYNDYDKSVKNFLYGIEAIQVSAYDILGKVTPAISLFLKEMFGYWIRYCLINGYSPNLFASPTPGSLSVVPHPNTLCAGLATTAMQPAENYTNNNALMASIIACAMQNIPATTGGALTPKTVRSALSYFTTGTKHPLKPLDIGGQSMFILTVPTSQKNYILDPSVSGSLGSTWQAISRYMGQDEASLPQYLGTVDNVILIHDPRAPIAVPFGTGSGSSTSSGTNAVYVDEYLLPGLNDQRTALGTTDVMEACFFLGKGAVADLEPEPPHYEMELQMTKKYQVKNAAGSRGFNRMDYDLSTATSTSKINQSSGIIWCRKQVGSW